MPDKHGGVAMAACKYRNSKKNGVQYRRGLLEHWELKDGLPSGGVPAVPQPPVLTAGRRGRRIANVLPAPPVSSRPRRDGPGRHAGGSDLDERPPAPL